MYCIYHFPQIAWDRQIIYTNCMLTGSRDHRELMCDVLNLCCRNKTGILGWRSEKTETVNGYEAKVEHRLLRQLSDLSHCPETSAVRAQFDIS